MRSTLFGLRGTKKKTPPADTATATARGGGRTAAAARSSAPTAAVHSSPYAAGAASNSAGAGRAGQIMMVAGIGMAFPNVPPQAQVMRRSADAQQQRPFQIPVRRSPPASPVPLMPEPRIVRLFPEDEYLRTEDYSPQREERKLAQQPAIVKKENKIVPKYPEGEKGLVNNKGEYNCFINVVIQALWHLTAFRERFLSGTAGSHHCCPGPEGCVHCALQYQFSEECIIPPTNLRQALAVLYKDESRFQLNEIDDAAEALEAVLNRLHGSQRSHKESNISPLVLEKKACPCLVHNTFGVRTMDLLRCETCAATTDPKATSLFIAYAYTYALREAKEKAGNKALSLCQLINQSSQQDRRWCPNAERCNRMCVVEHHLLYLPKVFSVGLVWTTVEGAPKKEIEDILDMITMEIDLSNIFITNTAISRYMLNEKQDLSDSSINVSEVVSSLSGSGILDNLVEKNESNASPIKKIKCIYQLRGMICYYGQHYSCYFNSPITKQWYVFDDVMVIGAGADWASVKERCLKGHLQPSVLFYEKKEIVEEECCEINSRNDAASKENPAERAVNTKPTSRVWDNEEALKCTMEAEILEMLMAGEEEWRKEKERERDLAKIRERENAREMSVPMSQEPEPTHHIQHLEKPTDFEREPETRTEEQTSDQDREQKPTPSSRVSSGQFDDWEIIENIPQSDRDDVEIVFENDNDRAITEDQEDSTAYLEDAHRFEQDDVEIVDGDEYEDSPLKTPSSSFTVLSPLDKDDLDISFTMINDQSLNNPYIDVEVTQTSWLYRRYTKIYRFTSEEVLCIDPDTQAVKEAFRYDEIAQLLLYGSLAMVIRMKPDCGKTCGYVDGQGAEHVAELLCQHNHGITLTIQK